MKKIIFLLTAFSLTATAGTSIISCQTNKTEDPLYNLPEMPQSIEKVKELMGYYWDLHEFYNKEYFDKDVPKKIEAIDSDNFQKNVLFGFFSTSCLSFIGYQLGQRGGFDFQTPHGNRCFSGEINKEGLYNSRETLLENPIVSPGFTKETIKQINKWYDWALTAPSITF